MIITGVFSINDLSCVGDEVKLKYPMLFSHLDYLDIWKIMIMIIMCN